MSNARDNYFSPLLSPLEPGGIINTETESIVADVIDTSKLGRLTISNEMIRVLLDLPDDVKVTSMHTIRGDERTGIYLLCDRFDSVPRGGVSPELSIDDVKNKGLWDAEAN